MKKIGFSAILLTLFAACNNSSKDLPDAGNYLDSKDATISVDLGFHPDAGSAMDSGSVADSGSSDAMVSPEPRLAADALEAAVYVPMSDGVRIAVEVRLPHRNGPLPIIFRGTRYFRQLEALAPVPGLDLLAEEVAVAHARGYGLVVVDARGSGASFGTRPHPWSEREISDYRHVIDWLVQQPWSNGEVVAQGISYSGNVADAVATLGHPAVKAAAPQFADIDTYADLAVPGGAPNDGFVSQWSASNAALDANDFCTGFGIPQDQCGQVMMVSSGVKPVDADSDRSLRAAAIAEHQGNHQVFDSFRTLEAREDTFGGATLDTISPIHRFEILRQQATPLIALASWLDSGTIQGVLRRYMQVDTPQTVLIGPWAHGGAQGDPFDPMGEAMSREQQLSAIIDYYDAVRTGTVPARSIRYYTMAEGVWRQTDTWPPASNPQKLYFATNGELVEQLPAAAAQDSYQVDFEAASGPLNRWMAVPGQVSWPDRAAADQRLMVYQTAPFMADTRITGSPTLELWLSVDREDGLVIAYLEDVAPDGTVTMITEAPLRLSHRAETILAEPSPTEVHHPYTRAQMVAMPLNTPTKLRLSLLPTSVMIRSGHRLRLALAGHDATSFRRIPEQGMIRWQLHRGGNYPSSLTVPVAADSN